jgi:hypothetical protein
LPDKWRSRFSSPIAQQRRTDGSKRRTHAADINPQASQVDARKDAQFRVTAVESHDWKAILMIHSALILAMCVAGVAAAFSTPD